jgi:5-methylcytosine-specific restriction endonuclease McrA
LGRPAGELNRCGGRWTNARWHSFIKSLLRSGTRRWAPIADVKKDARVSRGEYKCAGCGEVGPATIKIDGKRVNNAVVDHIHPIIDPEVGFVSWDETIERMFCEEDNLQVLCYTCHTEKSNNERATAKERRARNKLNDEDE